MLKPRNLVRLVLIAALLWGSYLLLFLQEWGFAGSHLSSVAAERGIPLPLQEPRIVVDFSDKTLSVYSGDDVVKRYDVAVGKNHEPGILNRAMNSTPLGRYTIIGKWRRLDTVSHGSRFMEIDFPSPQDVDGAWEQGLIDEIEYERCCEAMNRGEPMPRDLGIGGGIGIQGNFFAFMGHNFTDGSIALSNHDINDLFHYIPVGCPVVIRR